MRPYGAKFRGGHLNCSTCQEPQKARRSREQGWRRGLGDEIEQARADRIDEAGEFTAEELAASRWWDEMNAEIDAIVAEIRDEEFA